MRILEAAARLFRESGYDGVGVDAIMSEAGLTAGGFYAHFSSKEALFAETMATALEPGKTMRPAMASVAGSLNPLTTLIKSYLSRTHRDRVADGCPLPVLTPDVARKSDITRENYEQQFLRYVNEIERLFPENAMNARECALAIVAQCVGGLMLSRAVKNEKLSDQILKSSRAAAMSIVEEQKAREQ